MSYSQLKNQENDFAIYDSPFGKIKIQHKDGVVIFIKRVLAFTNTSEIGIKTSLTDLVYHQLCEYFNGERKNFTFKYQLIGTEFQKKVWHALTKIPYGKTCSYKDIALYIGNPKACRAVGLANNKNPLTIVVPCHRVIGANGSLTGYFGGLDMKKQLLELEQKYQ